MYLFYLVLLVLYIPLSIYHIVNGFSVPLLFTHLIGLIVLLRQFFQELKDNYMPLYFWWERLRLTYFKDTTSVWWFHARYDGINSIEVFENLYDALKGSKFKIKQLSATNQEMEWEIDETIRASLTFTPSSESSFSENHIDVVSRKIEVSYSRAKEKLAKQIEPLLQALEQQIKPEFHSFVLNVEFQGKNPFFNVYIAHLPPSQVEDFRVILHIDGNSPNNKKDRIEISKSKVRITADSTNSFRKLAEDFILLTPDTKLLLGDKNA